MRLFVLKRGLTKLVVVNGKGGGLRRLFTTSGCRGGNPSEGEVLRQGEQLSKKKS